MASWVPYSVAVYFGLMFAGTLAIQPPPTHAGHAPPTDPPTAAPAADPPRTPDAGAVRLDP